MPEPEPPPLCDLATLRHTVGCFLEATDSANNSKGKRATVDAFPNPQPRLPPPLPPPPPWTMTELPSEAYLPFGGLDSRILGHGHGHERQHQHGAMPAYTHAGYFNYQYPTSPSRSVASSPLPPPYPPHHHAGLHPPSTAAGDLCNYAAASASPPNVLPPPPADLYAPSYFGRSPPTSQPDHHPSRHPLDASFNDLHRASSLSPPVIGRPGALPPASSSSSSRATRPLAHVAPSDIPGASLSRSVSADAAAPQQSSVHLVQRLAQQNALIRDAWEAERNYLEANRRRAEEVYQEERAIMEDVREGWENEKAAMQQEKAGLLRELQALKERVQRLEGENTTLKAVAAQSVQVSGVVSPLASQRGGSLDVSTESSSSLSGPAGFAAHRSPSHPSQQGIGPGPDTDTLPPGLDGASRRPHFASPGGSRMSPNLQPESSPFIPLDPRMQPQNSSRDFLSSPSEDADTPIPVIDVQEIDPKLEGIPIKATALQRSTFGEPSNKSSPATSPPVDKPSAEQAPLEKAAAEKQPPGPVKRVSSKDHTVQVLAVEESRRRTMHAGHTPNHSLSLFPGLSAAGGSAAGGSAAARSEGTTPTATSAPPEQEDEEQEGDKEKEPEAPGHNQSGEPPLDEAIVEPEAILEPIDDVPLKGPLMVKNIPAQDEIFWEQVNRKLETISQDNSLPTVMQGALDEAETVAGPSDAIDTLAQGQSLLVPPVGGDGSHDSHAEEPASETGGKSVEPDLPLKLRSTTNFGAPFGVM